MFDVRVRVWVCSARALVSPLLFPPLHSFRDADTDEARHVPGVVTVTPAWPVVAVAALLSRGS
jgi:hypothetical protein